MVFTAGLKEYADPIINELDPNQYISRRLYRDSCQYLEGVYMKDLKVVSPNTDLKRIVIVDNIANNFGL